MDMKALLTVAAGPYPTTEGIQHNGAYANLLLNDYAGFAGETSAILQYMYQHYVVSTYDEEMAKVLERIAVTEMRHHELLGKCILALGGNPILINSSHQYFTSRYINYTDSLIRMLNVDVDGERAAISGYHKALRIVKDVKLREILLRIIADEEVHLKTFQALLTEASSRCRKSF